jgi:tripartite ATP-independent transporter DctP family solute receptor
MTGIVSLSELQVLRIFSSRISRAFIVTLLVFTFSAAAAFSDAASAQQITIRLNHTFGPGTNADQGVKSFGEEIAKKTNGRIQVRVFPSGELADEREEYALLNTGAIEMALAQQLIPALVPEYGIVDMLYLWRDQEQLRKFYAGPIGDEIKEKILKIRGIRALGFIDRGARNLTTKDRPVKTPADLKGMKIRTLQVPAHIEAWRMLGATPVPMSINEVFIGLQQGVVDAQENPVEMIKSMSFNEVQKYLIRTGHHRSVIWFVISEKFYQSLSPEDRKLIESEAKVAEAYANRLQREQDASIEQELLSKGMIGIDPDREAFREAVSGLPAKFANQWQPGLYEKIQQIK